MDFEVTQENGYRNSASAYFRNPTSGLRNMLPTFRLSRANSLVSCVSFMRQGSVRLPLKFAAVLPATFTVVAYAEVEKVVEVDRDRNVIFNFGV